MRDYHPLNSSKVPPFCVRLPSWDPLRFNAEALSITMKTLNIQKKMPNWARWRTPDSAPMKLKAFFFFFYDSMFRNYSALRLCDFIVNFPKITRYIQAVCKKEHIFLLYEGWRFSRGVHFRRVGISLKPLCGKLNRSNIHQMEWR